MASSRPAALAADLRTADDVPTVYFAGAPRTWLGGFGNVDFLAPGSTSWALVRGWYPTGTRHDVEDENGHALYTEWRIDP